MTTTFFQNKIALVYDFDGTLSPQAMQHYGVLPALETEPSDFWSDVKSKRCEERSEELLVYMREMLQLAKSQRVKLDRAQFNQHGETIEFFEGVQSWFQQINDFVADIGEGQVEVEHYVISAGLKEMIEGCRIAENFKEIYACEFSYDEYGKPVWPARIISDTSKTQYLFRINKGVLDVNETINSHMPYDERRIPFDNMIYFGDGETDVPSMAVVMQNGGHAVAVHRPDENENKCDELLKAKRIDFYAEADYREGSALDALVKNTLEVISARIRLRKQIHDSLT